MATVQTNTPDDDREIRIARLADTQKSEAHISQLLAVANHASQFLLIGGAFDNKVEADTAATAEARKTYELAHIRLRGLIDEEHRWAIRDSHAEARATELMVASKQLLEQRTKNLAVLNRPSIFLNCRIAKFTVGWIAWAGGEVPTLSSLHGKGASPELAQKAFDDAYYTLEAAANARSVPEPIVVEPADTPSVPLRKPRRSKNTQ